MPIVSKNTLKILAAIVWISGALVLIIKGGSLFYEVKLMRPESNLYLLGIIFGFLIGGLKARFLMVNFCKKNLNRISKLNRPKLHQFFTPGFFIALFLMIAAGMFLSKAANGNFTWLLAVAVLDLGIGTALLTSSRVFIEQGKI
ncbi:MAG: hypothetical protein HND52_19100 [Ignavibacteriae bacterium]|nr:hypothetical protein [Ignavibacteriota bacterium]NOH00074.1 hypothetical protein [Ignavibacteriota bacterium]